MPRLTYKNWVGRQARVEVALSNKNGLRYAIGDVVMVAGYDRYTLFSIRNLQDEPLSHMWGVKPQKLVLLEGGCTIRQKVFRHLIRANAFDEQWVVAADISKAVQEDIATVSSILRMMVKELVLERRDGVGKRGGFGYRPRLRHLRGMTRYDKLMSDRDILGEV